MTPPERVYARTQVVGDCVVWQGAKNASGYGIISVNNKCQLVHRVVLGNVPADLTVDHVCHTRLCVRLDHLALMDRQSHGLKDSPRRDACTKGHSMHDAYVSGGQRWCRPCKLEKIRARRARMKESASA